MAASSSSSACDVRPMKRPGLGSAGTRVELLCNYFAVKYARTDDIFQYDVTVSYDNDPSDKPIISKNLCRKVISLLRERENMGKAFLFDGDKNLYSLGRLPFEGARQFKVTIDGDNAGASGSSETSKKQRNDPRDIKEFKVRVAFSVMVDMQSLEVLQKERRFEPRAQDALRVLDILLKEQASRRGYMLMRDSYFHSSLGPIGDVGGGALSWVGYHASFRPSSGGFSLNLDPSTTIVIKPQTVKDFAFEYLGRRDTRTELRLEDLTRVRKVLKGVEVQAYAGTKHKLFGFSEQPASSQTFELRNKGPAGTDPKTVTVRDYYMDRYQQALDFPNLPCVNVGKASRPVYIPMEFCKILPGQRYRRKLSGQQIRSHLQGARQNPGQRVQVIQQGVNELLKNSADILSGFNVTVDSRMMKLQGRVLNPPQLKFGNGDRPVRDGRWNYNTQTFVKPATIDNWAVVSFGRSEVEARDVATRLKACCEKKGMRMGEPSSVLAEQRSFQGGSPLERVNQMLSEMKKKIGKCPPTFILCILPAKDCDLYAPFKRVFWTQVGIVNQCLVPPRNLQDQYLSNVALKINVKNGGYNSVLTKEHGKTIPRVSQVPTVIVGMDVSHGSPFSSSSSIAAIVGSRDWPRFTQFAGRVSTQPRGQETIANIADGPDGGTFRGILRSFAESSKCKPQQIVIFRDGVSESQFQSVLSVEMQDIVKACENLEAGYRPKLTLVVVQKRHHTRFFPEGRGDQNIAPGTVVDTAVCHPENFDFFISTHKGLIGTTRPTHYIVLHDEIGFTPDEMQTFVNDMCYTYVKSTTAVSVVSPIYYAHIAAAKHRLLLDEDGSDSGSSHASQAGGSGGAGGERRPVNRLPPVQSRILNTMFWA